MTKNGLSEGLSGVRGIWPEILTHQIVRQYSIAYESFVRDVKGFTPVVVIGYDSRPSSKIIKSIIEDNTGCRIIDIGISTTPTIQNTVRTTKADGGIIISGSHNPLEYNGLKFLRNDGALLDPEDMDKLIKSTNGFDPTKEYIDFVLGLVGDKAIEKIRKYFCKGKEKKVLVDPNGGAACNVLEDLLEGLDVEYELINGLLGTFGREIEPKKDTLAYLVNKLGQSDIAFGFDCDADRAEVVIPSGSRYVEEFGNVVSGQYLLGLITSHMLKNLDGQAKRRYVVANDATSYLVKAVVESFEAIYEEVGTGEINVVNRMLELDALLAGEGSSSGFIHRETRCRDGVLTMLYIMALSSEQEKPLGTIIDCEIPTYYTLRDDKQHCDPEYVEAVKNRIIERYAGLGYRISIPDRFSGVKAIDNDGNWVWFRASATEAGQFRIFADSKSKEIAQSLLDAGREELLESTRNVQQQS